MKDSIGYDELHPIRNRVCRVAGRSSARIVPWPAGDSFRSSSAKKTNSPLKVSAMSAVPVAGSFRAVSLNSSVPAQLGFNIKFQRDEETRSPQAPSPQALRRQAVRESTSVECDPNHQWPQASSRGSLQADRGSLNSHKVLWSQDRRLGL